MSVTSTAGEPRERRGATLVMACLGVFVAYLPVTTVSVSLPAIQRALGASTSQLAWVSDAFVLPMAALILTAGVFGDVHGRKKVYVAGLALAGAGAGIALAAHSVEVLWAGQAVAGLGAAALLPTTLALISHAVPDPRKRGAFVGLWAASLLAALAIGPMLGGVILEHFDWRWIYLPSIPVALLSLAVAAPLLTDSRAPGTRRLDWPGQITAAVAISALVYGVIEGGAGSFSETRVVVALALAVASGIAFVLAERRSASPMLDLSLFRSAAFSATTLIAMITFLGLIGFFFVLSLYFGMVQRLDTLDAGYRLVVISVACLVVGAVAGRLMHRIPPRIMITAGLLAAAAALLWLTAIDAATPFGPLAWRLALLGVGMGLVITPMTAVAVAAVPHHMAGMAAAGNNAFRQVGGALGPAVLGTLLTSKAMNALPGHLGDAGLNGAVAHRITATADAQGLGAVAGMKLGPETGPAMGALSEAFLDGLRLCLVVAALLALLAAVIGAVMLRPPRNATAPAPSAAEHAERAEHAESESTPAPRASEVHDPRRVLTGAGAGAGGHVPAPGPPSGSGVPGWAAEGDGAGAIGAAGSGADGEGVNGTSVKGISAARQGAASAEGAGRAAAAANGPGLYGRIREAAGGVPLEATLTLISPVGRQVARTLARPDGRYSLAAPQAGAYVLIAAAEGCRPRASSLLLGAEPVFHDILLPARTGLAGAVVAAGDRQPVEGATVTVTDARGTALATETTDTSGEFTFGELPEGDTTVAVSATGFRPVALLVPVTGSRTSRVDVELWPGALVRGTVRAGADRRPLPDARVTLVDQDGNVVGTAIAGPDGAFAFTDLDAGDYSVIAAGYPPVTTPVAVDGSGCARCDVELEHPER
ncbi:MFS transporter [Streptomyces axinellae]|uniref:MFS transporter n=1 Tax=Streptomyces axinellae TaxID=552788 RepID=A0ABP6CIS5_9ACTN